MTAPVQSWAVTALAHPAVRDYREACPACLAQVEAAIIHAAVTGSVGATYATTDAQGGEHSATVARALLTVRQYDEQAGTIADQITAQTTSSNDRSSREPADLAAVAGRSYMVGTYQ